MKAIVYTRDFESLHPEAGLLKPGILEIASDALADKLLAAGAITGDFRLATAEDLAAHAAAAAKRESPAPPPQQQPPAPPAGESKEPPAHGKGTAKGKE